MRIGLVVMIIVGGACDAPHTLEDMKEDGIIVQVPLAAVDDAALQVEIDYDAVERGGCVTLPEGVRAEAGGLALSFEERGGWQEADGLFGCDASGCGACVPPRMTRVASDYAEDAPGTVVLEDETRTISLEIEAPFAARTMTRASPSTVRVGGSVQLEYARPDEELETLSATFIGNAQGGAACAASFDAVPLQEDGRYVFAVPAPTEAIECAGPWSGALRVSFAPKFVVLSCEGTERCTVNASAPLDVELPLTVVP